MLVFEGSVAASTLVQWWRMGTMRCLETFVALGVVPFTFAFTLPVSAFPLPQMYAFVEQSSKHIAY